MRNPANIKIIAGMNDVDGDMFSEHSTTCGGQIGVAKDIHKHPGYAKKTDFQDDIALIYMEEPFWINHVRNELFSQVPLISSITFRWSTIFAYHHQAGNRKEDKFA